MYQYITIYRQYLILKFEHLWWISYITLFNIRRYQLSFVKDLSIASYLRALEGRRFQRGLTVDLSIICCIWYDILFFFILVKHTSASLCLNEVRKITTTSYSLIWNYRGFTHELVFSSLEQWSLCFIFVTET